MPRPGPRRQGKTIRMSADEISAVQSIADREGLEWSEAARLAIARGVVVLSQPKPDQPPPT